MYLLFKSVNQQQLGIIQVIGSWMDYRIGYLPDSHKEIVEYRHLNARIIDEDVAWAWMFFGAARTEISVRPATPQNARLQVINSEEATGEKVKYQLTDTDIANTTKLMQEAMYLILDEIFDKRLVQANIGSSVLEQNSWLQQKTEAQAFLNGETNLPMLQTLANARGITLSEMVDKVNNAVAVYNANIAAMLATKQQIETQIRECASIYDCNRLLHNRFGIEMPVKQRTAEGIEYSAIFDI